MKQDDFINGHKLSSPINKIVILIPSLVLIGWLFNISLLKSVFPNLVAMNPTTAVLFILCGISLFLIQENRSDKEIKIGKFIGLGVVIISSIRLIGFNSSFDIGIDQLLFSSQLQGNRTSPNATVNFILIGLSLLLVNSRKKRSYVPSQLLALSVFITSLLGIIGYLYSATSLYRLSVYLPMRLHGAITFLLLSTGVLLSSYRFGLMSVIMHKNSGGYIARRLIPIGIAVPVLVGFLRLEGQRHNLFDPEFGFALGSITIITISSLLLWLTAKSLNKADSKRKMTELALIEAKDDLTENEIKYRSLIESSMDCIFLAVKGGNVLSANATARQMFQMTEKEICDAGRSLVDQTDLRLQVLLEERERTGKARGELTFIRKDGTRFPAEVSSVIFKDAGGLEKTSMTIRDITERKLAEEKVSMTSSALQQTLTDLNRIMNSSLDIICTINEEGKFAKVSAASEKIWGYTPAKLHGKITIDMVFKEDVEKTMKVATEVMEGAPVHLFENRVVHKDGSPVPMLWSARWDMEDKLMYCIAKDATKIKRLEEERMKIVNDLIQRNKELEQFTYILSHNLRAPVVNIMGFAEALENNSYSENLKKEVLSQLAVSVSKLDEVTRDLNEVLLIKEHVNDVTEELSFSKLVENIQISIQNLLDQSDIKIETDFSEVDKLVGIKPFIHSIFYNLITNSIKYRSLDRCPFIFIKSYKSHEGTQLIYSDNGFGIDLYKHQQNIFGLYKRFHQNIEGKGVGLFMIKSQIETLGGTIQLNSAVNRGTVFQIYLPFQTAQA